MATQVEPLEPLREARPMFVGRGGDAVPVAYRRFGIEQVDRALHEDRPRDPLAGPGERGLDQGRQVGCPTSRRLPLHVRRQQRLLIDVLQRAPPLEDGRGGPPEQHHRRLRQLGVLDRGDRVGEPRSRRHGRHAGTTGEPRGDIRREDRARLVPRVDHANAGRLGAHQQRRDVSAAEGEECLDAVPDEHLRDPFPAMTHRRTDSHSAADRATTAPMLPGPQGWRGFAQRRPHRTATLADVSVRSP